MTELWRTLLEAETLAVHDGSARLAGALTDLGSPEGVREVVSQRLGRLSTATTALLELTAVAGHGFDLSVVGRAGLADAALQSALEQAVAHGMIEEVPARRLAYQFTHELVRRALYDRMPGLRRAVVAESGPAGVWADVARRGATRRDGLATGYAALDEVKGHRAQASGEAFAARDHFRTAAAGFGASGQPLDGARCTALAATPAGDLAPPRPARVSTP